MDVNPDNDNNNNNNLGIFALNTDTRQSKHSTIVVCGPSRSGTTMLATILSHLGVNMGKDIDKHLYEDVEIRRAMLSKSKNDLVEIIKKNDNQNEVWGWKYPTSIEWLDFLDSELRNPRYIFTFRDPIAIAMRNHMAEQVLPLPNMLDSLNYMRDAIKFSQRTKNPALFISYEKAINDPKRLVEQTVSFIAKAASSNSIIRAQESVSKNNYEYKRAHSGSPLIGCLDSATNDTVHGWAWNRNSTLPVELIVDLDGTHLTQIKADQYREDLEREGIGSGSHSFTLNKSDFPKLIDAQRIDIRFATTSEPLIGSPRLLESR